MLLPFLSAALLFTLYTLLYRYLLIKVLPPSVDSEV